MAEAPSYHHGNLRAALVEAGLAALESSGNSELSLRELARQVGVSSNAAYRHFADKEALLVALAAEGFRRFAASLGQAAMQEAWPGEAFRAAGLAYVRFARANPGLFRLMFGRFASGHRDADLDQASLQAFAGLQNLVASTSGLQPDDPRALQRAMLAWSVVHGLSHLAMDGQLDSFTDDVEAMIEAVLSQAPIDGVAQPC
ncbi:MAG: TetR/AcrR family transcriptional regulator [Aquabacterium sp.]|nr:MAG: TetR/AcrR family transcriptional regulator [Aquabacterium sp.]